MASQNLFELLGDEESDASAVIERAAAIAKETLATPKKHHEQQQQQQQQQQQPAKLPSKPLPPAQAVRESRLPSFDSGSGSGRSRGRGRGRGWDRGGPGDGQSGYGYAGRAREFNNSPPAYRGGYQGDRRYPSEGYDRDNDGFQYGRGRRGGGFLNEGRGRGSARDDAEGGEPFESRQGRGRGRRISEGSQGFQHGFEGQEFEQAGHGDGVKNGANVGWGAESQQGASQQVEEEKQPLDAGNKQPAEEVKGESGTAEGKKAESEEEMSLDDYYKALDEKRKQLPSPKIEERKVVVDKEFERMTLVEKKKDEGTFVKLGPERDKGKKKENLDKEERPKTVSIDEFRMSSERGGSFIPANRRGQGRGRGEQGRGPNERGGSSGSSYVAARQEDLAPRIEDPGQFPTLGAK